MCLLIVDTFQVTPLMALALLEGDFVPSGDVYHEILWLAAVASRFLDYHEELRVFNNFVVADKYFSYL